jgi:hypothetical protein
VSKCVSVPKKKDQQTTNNLSSRADKL